MVEVNWVLFQCELAYSTDNASLLSGLKDANQWYQLCSISFWAFWVMTPLTVLANLWIRGLRSGLLIRGKPEKQSWQEMWIRNTKGPYARQPKWNGFTGASEFLTVHDWLCWRRLVWISFYFCLLSNLFWLPSQLECRKWNICAVLVLINHEPWTTGPSSGVFEQRIVWNHVVFHTWRVAPQQ